MSPSECILHGGSIRQWYERRHGKLPIDVFVLGGTYESL